MKGGDISNTWAPTLAIDIDGLIIITKKKFFGLSQNMILNPTAVKVCEHHMRMGRMIYLLAHNRTEREINELTELLDQYDFPYTKLFPISDKDEREAILGREHIHFYYFTDKHHAATDNKRKEKQIFNITETYF